MKSITACSRPLPRSESAAFTLLELLVAMGVTGLVAALLLPAGLSARESARRAACTSQLRQLGLAVQQHHDLFAQFPSAWDVDDRRADFAWGWASQLRAGLELAGQNVAAVLPEHPPALAAAAVPTQEAAAARYLAQLRCPSDIVEVTFALQGAHPAAAAVAAATTGAGRPPDEEVTFAFLPTASYVGVYGTVEADEFRFQPASPAGVFSDGPIVNDRLVRLADLRRGTSRTLLVGERTMAMVPSTWLGVDLRGADAECRLVGSAISHPNCRDCDECEFSSRHDGGVNFLWADGHVNLVADDIDTELYPLLARREAF